MYLAGGDRVTTGCSFIVPALTRLQRWVSRYPESRMQGFIWRPTLMTNNVLFTDAAGNSRSIPLPADVNVALAACGAIDCLATSLLALGMAFEASNKAIGLLGLPDEEGRYTEACELRDRWIAASTLLKAAIAAVDQDGNTVITQVKCMLAIA
jgi:hypothetical protein